MLRGFLAGLLMVLTVTAASSRADIYDEITAGPPRTVPDDYLGMHLHRWVIGPQDGGRMRTAWPDVPLGALRLWDARVRWADVEPQQGVWRFERLDTYVEAARLRGVPVRYVLGSTPAWASVRPAERCSYGVGCAAEPARLQDWENYVRTVARRYKGLIAWYELWNEPKFSDIPRDRGAQAFFTGSVADMVKLARVARRVLAEEDPAARLLAPGFVNGPDRLAMFLQAGGKAWVDGFAYHFYSSDARRFAEQVRAVRKVMREEGVDHLPLYNTETGVEAEYDGRTLPKDAPRRTPERAAGHVVQFMVLGAAAGLASYDFYAWDNDHMGAVDARGGSRPVRTALQRVQAWLAGARLEGCADAGGWLACRGSRADGPFILAWADAGKTVRIAPPAGTRLAAAERALDTARFARRADGTLDAELDAVPTLFRFEARAGAAP